MAVRIVSDFWTNYETHKDLIERCFHYLLSHRFPTIEGEHDAYDTMLVKLYELNVFSRFDLRRLIAQKMGMDKKNTYQISESDCCEEVLQGLGIDADKKFEQFVFKWIEHVLSECYAQRAKHAARYIPSNDMAEEPPRDSKDLWERLNECRFVQSQEESEKLEQHLDKKASIDSVKTYPTYDEIGNFVGSKMGDSLDNLVEEDLRGKIRARLQGLERKVFDLTLDGFQGNDIAEVVGCSPQNVNLILKRVRGKVSRYIREEPVTA
jgi:DNA-directed RNA polymerase specialized sigma24 family protein